MKKFNSILAIATVAITSVLGFTSCQQDDPWSDSQTPTPVAKTTTDNNSNQSLLQNSQSSDSRYSGMQIIANEDVLQYGDIVVTANIDGTTQQYKLSEGQSKQVSGSAFEDQTSVALLKAMGSSVKSDNNTYNCKVLTVPTFESHNKKVTFKTEFVANDAASKMDAESSATIVFGYSYAINAKQQFTLDATSKLGLDVHSAISGISVKHDVNKFNISGSKFLDFVNRKCQMASVN